MKFKYIYKWALLLASVAMAPIIATAQISGGGGGGSGTPIPATPTPTPTPTWHNSQIKVSGIAETGSGTFVVDYIATPTPTPTGGSGGGMGGGGGGGGGGGNTYLQKTISYKEYTNPNFKCGSVDANGNQDGGDFKFFLFYTDSTPGTAKSLLITSPGIGGGYYDIINNTKEYVGGSEGLLKNTSNKWTIGTDDVPATPPIYTAKGDGAMGVIEGGYEIGLTANPQDVNQINVMRTFIDSGGRVLYLTQCDHDFGGGNSTKTDPNNSPNILEGLSANLSALEFVKYGSDHKTKSAGSIDAPIQVGRIFAMGGSSGSNTVYNLTLATKLQMGAKLNGLIFDSGVRNQRLREMFHMWNNAVTPAVQYFPPDPNDPLASYFLYEKLIERRGEIATNNALNIEVQAAADKLGIPIHGITAEGDHVCAGGVAVDPGLVGAETNNCDYIWRPFSNVAAADGTTEDVSDKVRFTRVANSLAHVISGSPQNCTTYGVCHQDKLVDFLKDFDVAGQTNPTWIKPY